MSRQLPVARIHELTQIPRRTIQRAIANGELKAHKAVEYVTAPYLVDEDDMHAWLQTRKSVAS